MNSKHREIRMAMADRQYNEHCEIQNAAMKLGLDLLPSYPESNHLTIIDYGCSQGANSIEPLTKVLSSLPKEASATIHFEDTPYNDFTTLAKTVTAALPTLTAANGSILNIYPSLIPIGFYSPVLPPGSSADLGLAWSAFTYLESKPDIQVDATTTPEQFQAARNKALAEAGYADLIKNLKLRAREIRAGGYLVAAIGGNRPDGETEESVYGAAPFQPAMMKMVGTGKMALAELMAMALWPSYEITVDRLRRLLDEEGVRDLWEVEVCEARLVVHPAWVEYQSELEKVGDDEEGRTKACERYAQVITRNNAAAAGFFWEECLKAHRGADWEGGKEFLEELRGMAVKECVAGFRDMKTQIWYNYLRLKRKE